MNNIIRLIISFSCLLILCCSCQKHQSNNIIITAPQPQPEPNPEQYPDNHIYIGIFGGSLSSSPYSEAGKNMWRDSLGSQYIIETRGNGGAGFSNLTKRPVYVQIQESRAYDVYILWASLNDFYMHYITYKKENIGSINCYDLTTQSGGINYCYGLIQEKNPKAKILFFNTLPNFEQDKKIVDPYVKAQIDICKYLNIPCLDQNSLSGFTEDKCHIYYISDKVHLNEEGYKLIAPLQIKFLKDNLLK